MERNQRKFHYAWIILIALSVIVGIGKGALNNTAGLFLNPVAQDLEVGMGTLTLYFSVSAIVTMVFLPIGGKLMAKYDTRYIIIAGILLQAGAFALFGLMQHVFGWYVLAVPLAMGGVFITVIVGPVVINQWFRKSSGLALGILSAAGGLFGAIAQPVAAKLISGRWKIPFISADVADWRVAYISIGVVAMVIIIPIALFLIKRSPQAHGVQPYGADEVPEGAGNVQTALVDEGISVKVAKKSTALYMLILFFFLITSIASFSQHIPTHLNKLGFSIEEAGTVMSFYMVGILIGSLLLGILVDKLGSKITAIATMVIGILAIGTIIATKENLMIITIAVAVFGLISSSIGIIAPALTSTIFGKKAYSQIYATASMGLAISSIIALPAYGFIFDATKSYIPVLYILIAMLVLSIISVFVAFKDKNKLVEAGHWNSEVEEA